VQGFEGKEFIVAEFLNALYLQSLTVCLLRRKKQECWKQNLNY